MVRCVVITLCLPLLDLYFDEYLEDPPKGELDLPLQLTLSTLLPTTISGMWLRSLASEIWL